MSRAEETGADTAKRLLSRPLTPKRLLKLRRLLCDDPWKRPGQIDPERVEHLLDAIEKHPDGGEETRDYVHNFIVNAPERTLPALPDDIAEKVAAFQKKQAERKAGQR